MSERWAARRLDEELISKASATGEPVTLAQVPAGTVVFYDSSRFLLLGHNAAIPLGDVEGWTWFQEIDPGPPRPAPMVDLAKLRARAQARRAGGDAPALGGERAEGQA